MRISNPTLSIITISLNNKDFLEYTIISVIEQTFKNYEYIIIDGGSTDGTLDVIQKYKKCIHNFVTEKDSGIYNAINKGINLANGEWLHILNSGDRYHNNEVLSNIFTQSFPSNKKILYGNWFLCNLKHDKNFLISNNANISKGKFLHQSILYKKNLHNIYGQYIETKKLIISDYIFFSIIPEEFFFNTNLFISINDNKGVSSHLWSYRQKLAFDYILGKLPLLKLIIENIFILVPRVDLYILNRIKKIINYFV